MASLTQLSPSENAHRGEALYEQSLKQHVEPEHIGKFLVVDIETGDYEIGTDYIQPNERLLAKRPDAPLYALRIGYGTVGRVGTGHWKYPFVRLRRLSCGQKNMRGRFYISSVGRSAAGFEDG